MKRLIAIALFLAASSLSAADLTVTVPSAAVTNAVEMCELLRVEVHVRTSDWNNDLCATAFTRIGLRTVLLRYERKGQQQVVDAAVQAEVDNFDTDWPIPYTRAECGDSIVDTEFDEECDDGNVNNGDGCTATCEIEP